MNTLVFNNVYLNETAITGAKMEKQGPLSEYFDLLFDDLYCNEENFEKAEIRLVKEAMDILFKKSRCKEKDIELLVGGDLLNQIMSSCYLASYYKIPFIGTFSACSSFTLTLGIIASYIHAGYINKGIAFLSSHNATCERQFRYPLEYGIQKKETNSYTVTGASACLASNEKSKIKITSFTIGRVNDSLIKDSNDMGNIMAIAAYDTIKNHFKDLNIDHTYYDLILTGDLGYYGYNTLKELFKKDNVILDNYNDCGLLIFDRNNQEVYAGGSGCACSGVVFSGYIKSLLLKGDIKRVLLVATGALMSLTSVSQNNNIPSLAHALSFEVSL